MKHDNSNNNDVNEDELNELNFYKAVGEMRFWWSKLNSKAKSKYLGMLFQSRCDNKKTIGDEE